MPSSYITRSVYDFLTDSERDEIRGRVLGVCEDDCVHNIPNPYYGGGTCWALDESKIIADFPYPHKICTEGAKRSPETCWNGSVIHKEICRGNAWVPSGETCPVKVCTEGAVRSPETCWNGSVIHKEICRGNAWVSTGETCPTKPECSPGDKKAGYVCEEGKWQTAPVEPVPPVVPPVVPYTPPVVPPVVPLKYLTPAQADERVRSGLPCYIKCTLPVLNMLPGIPYTQGAWVPPFFTITSEP